MIWSRKLSKWIAIVLSALMLCYLAVDKLVLSPKRHAEFTGSATVSWIAPTENEDDSPLTDLAGYVIHCWTQTGQHLNAIYVNDPEATRYAVENLSPGTYHCAVAAINADGIESALSNMESKTVPSE